MVWKLSSVSASSPDAATYYFTAPGTYTVGRKGCPVPIASDKTVSRSHAEIVIQPLPQLKQGTSVPKCEASVRDLSKFGTFVNKVAGSRPVSSLPNKQTSLRDGDTITFGTGTSAYRLRYLHYYFCVPCQSIVDVSRIGSSIGAYCVESWLESCTHLLLEDGSLVTEAVLRAVGHKIPIASLKWLEAFNSCSSPCPEIPDVARYLPTLKLKLGEFADSVQLVLPVDRESTFSDAVFYIGARTKYHCKEVLHALVKAAGGSIEPVASRNMTQRKRKTEAVVIPQDANEHELREDFSGCAGIQRVREEHLVLAVLSGSKDLCAFYLPEMSAASESSDATIDLQDTADDGDSIAYSPELVEATPPPSEQMRESEQMRVSEGTEERNSPYIPTPSPSLNLSNKSQAEGQSSFMPCEADPGRDNAPSMFGEVKFADVVVRPTTSASTDRNFKSFKRIGAPPGNSFGFLVPFSSEPYSENKHEDEVKSKEFAQKEKRRISEEKRINDKLFKDEQFKRTRTTESISNYFETTGTKKR